ncbi:MAG: hypothetical protein RJB68_2475 [Pseudomonadota bacterium]|jgi:hypothetical protein
MSKYRELLDKAIIWGEDYTRAQIASYQAANSLRAQYSEYLDAPMAKISFFVLDRNLERSQTHELQAVPELRLAPDGIFYFGLAVNLTEGIRGVREYFVVGVVPEADKLIFSRAGRVFESPTGEPPVALMNFLFQQSCEQYATPLVGGANRSIGFGTSFVPAEDSSSSAA